MKVKFLNSLAGADFSYITGQITEIDDGWAAALISGGLAERVGEPDGREQNSSTAGDGAGDADGSQRVSTIRRKRS